MFCGRQDVAMRGHRDDGNLLIDMPKGNDGNFRALLRFAIESGDHTLENHFKTASANAMYTSHHIQNEIIETAGKLIIANIVQRINKSRYFLCVFDMSISVMVNM